MPFCTICERKVEFKPGAGALPNNCGLPDYCPYAEAAGVRFTDARLVTAWEKFGRTDCSQVATLLAWRKNPSNGLLFLQALKESEEKPGLPACVRLLKLVQKHKLTYARIGDSVFGGGCWTFGFDNDVLCAPVANLKKLISTAHKAMLAREATTLRLVKAYFGYNKEDHCAYLVKVFELLLRAAVSGQAKKRTVLLCRGTADDSDNDRTFGYVRTPARDVAHLGADLGNHFRCICLTDACFGRTDPHFPAVDSRWIVATSILHELTHLVLNTEDKEVSLGTGIAARTGEAYGRELCGKLAIQYAHFKNQELSPLLNADSLAFFAYDLRLLKDGVVSVEQLLEKL